MFSERLYSECEMDAYAAKRQDYNSDDSAHLCEWNTRLSELCFDDYKSKIPCA